MKKTWLIICIAIIASCGADNFDTKIIGTWEANSLKNPGMEREIKNALADLDTFGKNDPELKGVNVDSFNVLRKQQLEEDIRDQQANFQRLQFEFAKNKIVYMGDGNYQDSAMWSIEENQITVDGPALTGMGDIQVFTIQKLEKNTLTLQMVEGVDTSVMELVRK